ncbi:hypothetical protein SCLCIDRAFT_843147 [Scleroderma citrinum Foug A]|uniref:Uncharacterized protein n=1 Tax=Scleroderma citrinum Foug A TaxID=1036808 RepID=A0A0C3DN14_9AGAM|nr:hypothetical protein SCLCIDRAFT_843147 [Scleroderma citrinum Foug A]
MSSPLFNENDTSDCTFISSQGLSPHSLPSNSPTLPSPVSQRSLCSLTRPPPTIRFAPLPKINATRKRLLPPLGVSARSRRKYIPQEGRSILWPVDPIPEESVEDPILVLGKLVKRVGIKMWQRVKMRAVRGTPDNRKLQVRRSTGDLATFSKAAS